MKVWIKDTPITLGRVDKRDSHDVTDMIQDSFQMGGYLGAESYVERGMGVL